MTLSLKSWTRFVPWMGYAIIFEGILGLIPFAFPSRFQDFYGRPWLVFAAHGAVVVLLLMMGIAIVRKA